MMIQLPQAHIHGKYDNDGKDWYFRFDDDNNNQVVNDGLVSWRMYVPLSFF